jgi:hypothetical protein
VSEPEAPQRQPQPGELYRAGNTIIVVGSGHGPVSLVIALVSADLHVDQPMMQALYQRWIKGNGLPLPLDLTRKVLLEAALTR